MSFSTLVSVIFFAGGLLCITSLPLLPKARGFFLMAVGVALASLAMAHWTIAPSYPAFGRATRSTAPYGFGLASGLLLTAIVLWVVTLVRRMRRHGCSIVCSIRAVQWTLPGSTR